MAWNHREEMYKNINKLWEDELKASAKEYISSKNDDFINQWYEEWNNRFKDNEFRRENGFDNFKFLQEFKTACKHHLGRNFPDNLFSHDDMQDEYKLRAELAAKLPDSNMKDILNKCLYNQYELDEAQELYSNFEYHRSTHAYYTDYEYRKNYDAIEEQVSEWQLKSKLVCEIAMHYVPEDLKDIINSAKYEASIRVPDYPAELNAYQQMHVDKAVDEYAKLMRDGKEDDILECLEMADKFQKQPEYTHIYAALKEGNVVAMMAGVYSLDMNDALTEYAMEIVDGMEEHYLLNKNVLDNDEVKAKLFNFYDEIMYKAGDTRNLLLLGLAARLEDNDIKDAMLGKVMKNANMNSSGYEHFYGQCTARTLINTAYETLKEPVLDTYTYQKLCINKYAEIENLQQELNKKEQNMSTKDRMYDVEI